MTSNDDIILMLGKLLAQQEATTNSLALLRGEVKDEKDSAHDSRAAIHRRLDDQTEQIGRLRTDVAISGEVDAQLRDRIKTLSDTVDANHKKVQPALDDWGRVKVLGWGVGFVFLSLGISAASIYAWAWEWAKGMARWISGH